MATPNKPAVPPFRGMMPIMPTAIREDGTLDEGSQRRLVQYCLQCGAVAIGHFGIASEFHKLSVDERRRLTAWIVDEVGGRVPVFLGVTAPSDHVAVEYAKEAEGLGADIIMAAVPYVTVPGPSETMRYYGTLSSAVSVPIIVQDTPLSSPTLTAEFVWRMYNEFEHIHYIKAEGSDFLEKSAQLLEISGGAMPVIGGAGGKHLIHMLRVGVTSFMTGTEALDIHNSVVQAYLSGDEETAADLYFRRLLPYFVFYTERPDHLLKGMLHARGVVDCPRVIPPEGVPPLSPTESREFKWILDRIGFHDSKWPDLP